MFKKLGHLILFTSFSLPRYNMDSDEVSGAHTEKILGVCLNIFYKYSLNIFSLFLLPRDMDIKRTLVYRKHVSAFPSNIILSQVKCG